MNVQKTITTLLFIGIIAGVFGYNTVSAAAVPSIVGYQGRLSDSSGNLLGSSSGTTYYFKFSIWDNATVGSGSRVWPTSSPTSIALSVRQGVFNSQIGNTANGFPHVLDYDFASASDVYLQVEVSSDNSTFQTLSPRQRISATPFARVASSVSGSTTPRARLSVHADSLTTYNNTLFAVASSTASATTTHFIVAAGGNVGVGTTTPGTLFAINGIASFTFVYQEIDAQYRK